MRSEQSGWIGRLIRRLGVAVSALLLATVLGPGPAEARQQGKITATYDAGLGAVTLGTFSVTAAFSGADYDLSAKGRFSLLAGLLYKATGRSTSRGTLSAASPVPARFAFSYEDNKKSQKLRMTFADGTVRNVEVTPKKRPDKRAIPIPQGQLTNVLDPLTAAFLSVRSTVPPGDLAVCNQTIRIFDGKQRFDLQLSPKRSETLGSRAPRVLSRTIAVCRVGYEPIGGYRPNHPGVQFMKKADGVEVWLAKVPGTDIYLPYKVVVPTTWGSGTATLTGLKTTLGAAQRAAAP